jgi:hypothetical protein
MLCWVREGNSLRQLFREEFPHQLFENGRWFARFDITDLQDKSLIGYLYQPIVILQPNFPEEFQLADAIRAAKALEENVSLSFDVTPSSPPQAEQGFGFEGNRRAAEEIRDLHKHYNQNTSQYVRQLAFAGIAVIWLFKINSLPNIDLPRSFISPLLLFVITLMLDFIHFALGSWLFGRNISTLFARWADPRGLSGWSGKFYRKEQVQGVVLMGSPALRLIFWTKVTTLALGYTVLIVILIRLTALI